MKIEDLSDPETPREKVKRLYYEKFLPGAKKAVAAGEKARIVTQKVLDKLPAQNSSKPLVSRKPKGPKPAAKPPRPSENKQVIEIRHVYVTEAKKAKGQKKEMPEERSGYHVNDFVLGRGKYR